jgi:hypothetical protein
VVFGFQFSRLKLWVHFSYLPADKMLLIFKLGFRPHQWESGHDDEFVVLLVVYYFFPLSSRIGKNAGLKR